jgi:uncharacterized membrane protein YdjX (TVP38/TMEM64 family)
VRRPSGETGRWLGLTILVLLVSAAAAFWWGGGSEWFLEGDFEQLVRRAGAAGPVVLVVSMWLVQPAGLPGFLWAVPAGVVWPWPIAVGLCWLGNMGASLIAFAWARAVGRNWVAPRLPPMVQAFDQRLAAGDTASTSMVIMLRLLTGQLSPADWLLGVSRVRVRAFAIGTGIGIVPGLVVAVLGGPAFLTWVSRLPVAAQAALALAAVVVVLLLAVRRKRTGVLARRIAGRHGVDRHGVDRRDAGRRAPRGIAGSRPGGGSAAAGDPSSGSHVADRPVTPGSGSDQGDRA